MTRLLSALLGRMPIGWLQLTHNRSRLITAIAGVAFANVLVFVQLGVLGALGDSVVATYKVFDADVLVSASDANTLTEGGNVARQRMFQALSTPGVESAAPLLLGNVFWEVDDDTNINFQVIGIDPSAPAFVAAPWSAKIELLKIPGAVLIDEAARGLPLETLSDLSSETRHSFELNGRRVVALGTVQLGGGFSADGILLVSDQTFLRMFPNRTSRAPDHIMVRLDPQAHVPTVLTALRQSLPADLRVRTMESAAADDQRFQTTERPTGLIFGFGVVMGTIVGLIIVYQILSTDVADHLREYATFKAMGYRDRFFIGIVLEEAVILAAFGFIPGFIVSALLYSVLASATALPVEMNLLRAVSVLGGTAVACVASGAIATRRLAASDPADLF